MKFFLYLLRFHIILACIAFLYMTEGVCVLTAGSLIDFILIYLLYLLPYTMAIGLLQALGINYLILGNWKGSLLFSVVPFFLHFVFKVYVFLFAPEIVVPIDTDYTFPWYKNDAIILPVAFVVPTLSALVAGLKKERTGDRSLY